MNQYDEFEDDDTAAELIAATRVNYQSYDDETTTSNLADVEDLNDIPEPVREYIVGFYNAFISKNVYELHKYYENRFNRLSNKYYAKNPWPAAEKVASLVNNDVTFLIFYRELIFRHVYANLFPNLEQRFQSYENYCDLFNFILNSGGPVDIELPTSWAWDICDEFIYQYQSFCSYRLRISRSDYHEKDFIKENPAIWSSYSVLNVLYSLIQKSRMNERLAAIKRGLDESEEPDEYENHPLYRMLGYFGIIGLLRVHCLLGDFTLALKVMDNIELDKKALFARVTACHFTTYYYVGFAYMIMHRYQDAIKAFSHILLYVARISNHKYRNMQYDQITKKGDQMFALLAMCVSLCPCRIDDVIHSQLKEKYGEQLNKMQKGGEVGLIAFQELFAYASPKFIDPLIPDYDSNLPIIEPQQHHMKIFCDNYHAQMTVPSLRNSLKLYSTMSISKASSYLRCDQDDLRTKLMILKTKSRQLRWNNGILLDGTFEQISDIDVALERDMINITEAKTGRRYGDYFTRNIIKNYGIQELLRQVLNVGQNFKYNSINNTRSGEVIT